MPSDPYILWLPSWYPNDYNPVVGDFIQRHAKAASRYIPIVVVHFVQAGPNLTISKKIDCKQTGPLSEYVVYLPYQPFAPHIINKAAYQFKFYAQARKFLKTLFEKIGKPVGVHVQVPVKAGNIALWLWRRYRIPYLLTEHSSAYFSFIPDSYQNRSWLYQRQVNKIYKHAISVNTVSQRIASVLQEIFQVPAVSVIHNVVDTGVFHPVPMPLDIPFTFLHVSEMNPNKNPLGIIKAFAAFHNQNTFSRLVMVGPLSEELREAAAKLGISANVSFTGFLQQDLVAKNMQEANALVLFSNIENFPCVIAEAHCCGLPVIASAVGGVPEAINSDNGILVEPGDVNQLYLAMLTIQERYSSYDREKIAANARSKYSEKVIGHQIFNLYKENFHIGHTGILSTFARS